MQIFDLNDDSQNKEDLTDKAYLITGAANGIGRAIALALANHKTTIILLDKDAKELNTVYDQIVNDKKGTPIIVHQDLNVLTQTHCDALVNQIQQSLGRLDAIIHCASETGQLAPIQHYSDEDWSTVIRSNLHSPYLLTRSLLPILQNENNTNVIFTLSEQAIVSSAYWGAFAVAQQGLKALVQTWSQEIENTNISMTMIDPGKVNTAFLVSLYPGLNPNQYPEANQIAKAYMHLLMRQENNDLNGKLVCINEGKLVLIK